MSPNDVANQEVFATLISLALVMSVTAYVFVRLRRSLRRGGYQSPFVSWYFGFAYFAMLAAALAIGSSVSDLCWHCSPAESPEYFQPDLAASRTKAFVLGVLAATVAGSGLTALAVWLTPRGQRKAGTRRVGFPWQGCAYLCLALIAVVIVLALAGYPEPDIYKRFKTAFQLTVLLFGGYAVCQAKARQTKAAGLDEVLAADQRPPVLYLRPFEREDDVFASLTDNECRALDIPVLNPQALRHPVTFEAYLARTVQTELGPFVALGDPEDYLPPLGAARKYFSDESWRESFLELLTTSVCTVTTVGHSENLLWEMQTLRAGGHHTRLFVLTRPVRKSWWRRIFPARSKPLLREWSAFAAVLKRCGLTLGDYPGNGATIGFDQHGHAHVIAANAQSPHDYVAAIASRLPVQASKPHHQAA